VLDATFANQRISIQTEAPAASLVVISQSHYPAWRAYVDGRPATIWRANYAFQALQVPAGRHQVQLIYQDRAFLTGAVLSGLGLLACAALWSGRFIMITETRRKDRTKNDTFSNRVRRRSD